MVTTLDRIISEFDRDLRSIEVSVEEAKSYGASDHSEEIVFFEMARNKIQEAMDNIRGDAKLFPKAALDRERLLREHFDKTAKEEPTATATATSGEGEEGEESSGIPIRSISYEDNGPEAYETAQQVHFPYTAVSADDDTTRTESGTEVESDIPSSSKTVPAQGRHRAHNQPTNTFYFYQAANGHHLYLQPLDIRILKQHFETYEKFPDTIQVKVLGIEETNLTEEVRKKCKYLGHLPLGCEVSFLDVILEDIVGKAGVKPFETELRLRRSKRLEKEVREERERIAREHKLNPPKTRTDDDFFINDPFFQTPTATLASTRSRMSTDAELAADLQEAQRLSEESLMDDMPTLSEAHARSQRPASIPGSGSNPKDIPHSSDTSKSAAPTADHWGSSYESSSSTGQRTVWGTPSVPVSRHFDDYEDDYEDEHDYEPEVVVKRGKKKVVLMSSNSTRRTR